MDDILTRKMNISSPNTEYSCEFVVWNLKVMLNECIRKTIFQFICISSNFKFSSELILVGNNKNNKQVIFLTNKNMTLHCLWSKNLFSQGKSEKWS